MSIQSWLAVLLATVDLSIVSLCYVQMRGYPRIDRRTLCAIGAGMVGFVFHAFLFFQGAFLVLQLATISGILGICWLQHLGRLSRPKVSEAE